MTITYTVPTTYGTATRKSASHTMSGQRYRFVAVHVWACPSYPDHHGKVRGYTWHSRRDLAQQSQTQFSNAKLAQIVEITDEHCREPAKRAA